MVDEHRRVESRGIIGSGMATDPDRIRDVEAEYERRMRQDRERPAKSFAATLEEAPIWEGDPEEDPAAAEAESAVQDAAGAEAVAAREPNPPTDRSTVSLDVSDRDLGATISAADLQHKLMRFRR